MSFLGTQVDPNDPNVPQWYKAGFGDEASYNAAYGITASAAAPPAPAPSVGSGDISANTTNYGGTEFNNYLLQNPQAASASGYIQELLAQYNLTSLAPFVSSLIQQGWTDTNLIAQQIYATPEFKQEFPEIDQRNSAGQTPMSPGDIVNARQAYAQALHANGIDASYVSKDQMSKWITNNVSPAEVNDRLTSMVSKIQQDPLIAPQLHQLYGQGVTPGEIAAFYLDPDHAEPYLQKVTSAATAAARAQQAGFGQLNQGQAELVGAHGLSDQQLLSGFGDLAQQQGLLRQGISETSGISNDTALAAQFQNNAQAQQQLARRKQSRESAFSGGGNFADANQQGLTGAGVSNR